jgi:hypothetical protein
MPDEPDPTTEQAVHLVIGTGAHDVYAIASQNCRVGRPAPYGFAVPDAVAVSL